MDVIIWCSILYYCRHLIVLILFLALCSAGIYYIGNTVIEFDYLIAVIIVAFLFTLFALYLLLKIIFDPHLTRKQKWDRAFGKYED
ncbi:hypothetical protein B0187_01655 [Haemophilus paracuniculus]|uniref:Uncharacterized protein n=1 Tax=Haemophilus paracuniculus TaxID=734 RepID=A0A1T0AU53_9PAST|nr:hypothetical protein [Haemophilus paracuniculus]OOS00217.1 hypothetical protein B0187_01655 [Haemophilus paracuniculus]